MKRPHWSWLLWAVAVAVVVGWRWPQPAAPTDPHAMVCDPTGAERLLSQMRLRMSTLASILTAAGGGESTARATAAATLLDTSIPPTCIEPPGWAELDAQLQLAWRQLADPKANEERISEALTAATDACVRCHDAHVLVVRPPLEP